MLELWTTLAGLASKVRRTGRSGGLASPSIAAWCARSMVRVVKVMIVRLWSFSPWGMTGCYPCLSSA